MEGKTVFPKRYAVIFFESSEESESGKPIPHVKFFETFLEADRYSKGVDKSRAPLVYRYFSDPSREVGINDFA